MSGSLIKQQVESELARAVEARAGNNEGQARVSARRAAGMLIREFLERQGIEVQGMSAYDVIVYARDKELLDHSTHEILDHMILRVEPGGEFPSDIDLIKDTRSLMDELKLE